MQNLIKAITLVALCSLGPAQADAKGTNKTDAYQVWVHQKPTRPVVPGVQTAMNHTGVSTESQSKVLALLQIAENNLFVLTNQFLKSKQLGDPVGMLTANAHIAQTKAELFIDIRDALTANEWKRVKVNMRIQHTTKTQAARKQAVKQTNPRKKTWQKNRQARLSSIYI